MIGRAESEMGEGEEGGQPPPYRPQMIGSEIRPKVVLPPEAFPEAGR